MSVYLYMQCLLHLYQADDAHKCPGKPWNITVSTVTNESSLVNERILYNWGDPSSDLRIILCPLILHYKSACPTALLSKSTWFFSSRYLPQLCGIHYLLSSWHDFILRLRITLEVSNGDVYFRSFLNVTLITKFMAIYTNDVAVGTHFVEKKLQCFFYQSYQESENCRKERGSLRGSSCWLDNDFDESTVYTIWVSQDF